MDARDIEEAVTAGQQLDKEYAQLKEDMKRVFAKQASFQKAVTRQRKLLRSMKAVKSEELDAVRSATKGYSDVLPARGDMFFSSLVGSLDISIYGGRTAKLAYKDATEKYKLRFYYGALASCILLLLWEAPRYVDMLQQLAIVVLYVSSSLRESVLRSNGSSIKLWYSVHHLLSIVLSITMVTWDTPTYASFRRQFLIFSISTAALGVWSAIYQRHRLYTLRALGKVGKMTTAMGDVPQVSSQMKAMVPAVVFCHGFQAYNAYTLWSIAQEWQTVLASIVFLTLAIGNLWTLATVLRRKLLRASRKVKEAAASTTAAAKESAVETTARTKAD